LAPEDDGGGETCGGGELGMRLPAERLQQREARGGGSRARARVAWPLRFIGAGRSRAGHGRPAAAKRWTPAESCTERTAPRPRWVPRAGSGPGRRVGMLGCGLRA
jgi:hypothetical protein